MILKRFFVQSSKEPRSIRHSAKTEARIAMLTNADLREWIDQYMYVIGRSLSEYAKDPRRREFLDEAVEAGHYLNICLEHLTGRV